MYNGKEQSWFENGGKVTIAACLDGYRLPVCLKSGSRKFSENFVIFLPIYATVFFHCKSFLQISECHFSGPGVHVYIDLSCVGSKQTNNTCRYNFRACLSSCEVSLLLCVFFLRFIFIVVISFSLHAMLSLLVNKNE